MLTPVLMLMLLGSVDFGRAMYAIVTVNNAAFHSAVWTQNHLKYGTAGSPSCGGATSYCCPAHNNDTAYVEGATPTTIREIVLRDFLVGLTYTSSCATATTTSKTASVGSTCNPAVSCSTGLETGYTYGGGTQYRYVDITVTYRWNAVGPYDVLLGSYDIPKTMRVRKVP